MAYGRQTSFNLLIIAVLLSVITIACCSYQKRFGGYVPVYVMMPLDTVNTNNQLNNPQKIQQQLSKLKSVGVDGIMIDCWWGLVEESPKQYDFSAYRDLVTIVQSTGLKMQVVMSFHKCGGNVGDSVTIPLPQWVLNVGQSNPDIFYTDAEGHRDDEYLSWGVDNQNLFQGRSALQLYGDFMSAFANEFSDVLGSVITEVQVGLGPAGEMRYPSYQNKYWNFPGVGEFQCYDKYMLSSLQNAANQAGHSDWGLAGPNDAGNYNSRPEQTGFFQENTRDNYESDYGRFFLNWYATSLIQHGAAVLAKANASLGGKCNLAAKVSGVHWYYNTQSHAAELTAGYNNAYQDGYKPIARMFAKYNVTFDFTALEMTDNNGDGCECGPQELVSQTQLAAQSAGIHYSGENALETYSQYGYQQIEQKAKQNGLIAAFTYLRLTDTLMQSDNLNTFAQFVRTMHNL
jgi:beta-amylase